MAKSQLTYSNGKEIQVGDSVRILDVDGIKEGYKHWETGDITEVIKIDDDGDDSIVRLKASKHDDQRRGNFLTPHELRHIEKIKNDYEQFLEYIFESKKENKELNAKYTALEERFSVMEKQLAELQKQTVVQNIVVELPEQHTQKTAKSFVEEILNMLRKHASKQKTNIELRKEIIEKAKKLVDKHTQEQDFMLMSVNTDCNMIVCSIMDKATGDISNGKYEIPQDICYNEHIGRAIALSKALGIGYDEFKNVPEPDKYVVGQIITFPESDEWYKLMNYRIDDVTTDMDNLTIIKDHTSCGESHEGKKANSYLNENCRLVIIEDTNAQY